jgi:hypothetical protein
MYRYEQFVRGYCGVDRNGVLCDVYDSRFDRLIIAENSKIPWYLESNSQKENAEGLGNSTETLPKHGKMRLTPTRMISNI